MTSRRAQAGVVLAAAMLVAPGAAIANDDDETARLRDRVRAEVSVLTTTRSFSLDGPSEVLFDAPFYSGLQVGLTGFPIAFFDRDGILAPLGVRFVTSKHRLNTLAEVVVDDESYPLDVPTGHDMTDIGALYEIQATPTLVVTPSVSWHAQEITLGYNALYRNSFYKSVDVGVRGDLDAGLDGLTVGAGFGVRPAVDLGSTAEPYGDAADALGLRFDAGLRYRAPFGLYGGAAFEYVRYGATYRVVGGDRDDSTSVDKFTRFAFTVGYAY